MSVYEELSESYNKIETESRDSPGVPAAGIFETLGFCDLGLRGK